MREREGGKEGKDREGKDGYILDWVSCICVAGTGVAYTQPLYNYSIYLP